MKHRVLSIFLVAVTLTACLFGLSITAMAADTEYGDFLVETTVEEGCSYADGVLTISEGGSYTVSMKEGISETSDTIVIDAAEVVLRLDNVQIASKAQDRPPLQLNHDASLEALGTVSLAGYTNNTNLTAGISGEGKTLTFLGGTLKAQGGSGPAADSYLAEIGKPGIQANVVMKAGTLEATGGNGSKMLAQFSGKSGGAGISGTVTVHGGTLKATGGNGGDSNYDAGHGASGIAGDVTINGGEVIATGGNGGNGFSSSYRGQGGNGVGKYTVQINRGTLTSLAGSPGSGNQYDYAQYSYNCAFGSIPKAETADRDVKLWVGSSPSDSEEADNYNYQKYAKYQVRMIHTLQFEGMGDADYDDTPTTSFIEGESAQIPNAGKANHHFLGWQINGLGDPVKDLILDGSQYSDDVTLTAIWREKDTFPLTAQPQSYSYNGQPQSYVLEEAFADVKVEYRVNESWTTQAPTDASIYDVRLTRPEDDTYKAFEKTLETGLVINRVEPVVVAPTVKTGLVYNGQSQALVTPGTTSGGTMVYSLNDGAWSEEVPSATEVGIYQIAYQVTGDANFKGIGVKTLPAVEILNPITSCQKDQTCPIYPYEDAKPSAWYHDGVHYCITEGLIKGYDTGLLGPNDVASRSQVVTLLWRAAGSPKPETTDCPFTDVKPSAFYYEAMLWAVETGITKGTSETTFAPNETCTRSQVVTFLWRAAGCPAPEASDCPFTDAKEDSFYYEAMLWAVETGITTGTTPTTFQPLKSCTRAEIATFLYRNKD